MKQKENEEEYINHSNDPVSMDKQVPHITEND